MQARAWATECSTADSVKFRACGRSLGLVAATRAPLQDPQHFDNARANASLLTLPALVDLISFTNRMALTRERKNLSQINQNWS